MTKNILITGGAGFIGSHLAERLLQNNPQQIRIFDNFTTGTKENLIDDERLVFCEDADLRDPNSIEKHLEDIDQVYHLAAVKYNPSKDSTQEIIDTNIVGTYNLLKACRTHSIEKVVFTSSLYVYGKENTKAFKETDPLDGSTLYGASKIAGEQMFHAYHKQFGQDYVNLRLFFAYGPRLYQKNYEYAFVNKTLDLIEQKNSPEIYGDGKQTFDYIYIADMVDAIIAAMQKGKTDTTYNVGTGVPTTINEVLEILLKLTKSDVKPIYCPKDETHGTSRVADTTKLKQELGYEAKTSLEDGLQKVIEWRKTN